jgi:hypothetical protein
MLYHSYIYFTCYITSSVCHITYHFNLSSHALLLPAVFTDAIPPLCVCHMLQSVTCYTTSICLFQAVPLPYVCHMLNHLYMYDTCYITPFYLSYVTPTIWIRHAIALRYIYITWYYTFRLITWFWLAEKLSRVARYYLYTSIPALFYTDMYRGTLSWIPVF